MLAMQEQRELCSRVRAMGAGFLEEVLLHVRRQQAPDSDDGFSQRTGKLFGIRAFPSLIHEPIMFQPGRAGAAQYC